MTPRELKDLAPIADGGDEINPTIGCTLELGPRMVVIDFGRPLLRTAMTPEFARDFGAMLIEFAESAEKKREEIKEGVIKELIRFFNSPDEVAAWRAKRALIAVQPSPEPT